jgi:hypothetical protein
MQVSRGQPEVRVIRHPYTPRSHLVEGRFNALLRLEARVPSDSYLFIWSGEPKPVSLRPFMDEVKKAAMTGKVTLRYLESIFQRMMGHARERRMLRGEKSPPSYDGVRYIPGSSLKGALRSRIEYKFAPKMVKGAYATRACYIVQGDVQQGRHADFWGKDELIRRERLCSGERGEVCIVCDLFGAPSLSSRVQISDAPLSSGETEVLRDLGLEAFRPGSTFDMFVSASNLSYAELGLLLVGFEIPTKSPILLGFKKYFYNPKVGQAYRNKFYFGLVQIDLSNITVFNQKMEKTVLEPKSAIETSMRELKQSEYNDWIDYERGVIKI